MKSIVHWFSDLLFPPRCLACRSYGTVLCDSCRSTIPARSHQECIVCKHSSPTGAPCRSCQAHTLVDQLLTAGHADQELLSRAIYGLKYSFIKDLALPLSEYAFTALSHHRRINLTFSSNPLLVPVPLHPRRYAERGFNQAELLAHHLGSRIGMKVASTVLKRTRHTVSQVGTHSRWERLDNIEGAFLCSDPAAVAGRDIVLIDDVCTTGATLDACAAALKSAGASHVSAIVLARG